MGVRIVIGDMVERLRDLLDNSVDSCVCDPPYHLTSIVKRFGAKNAAPAKSEGPTGVYSRASRGFMGQTWDGGDVAFQVETWAEVMRVLKPGGFLMAFGGDRTFHRLAVAVEDAGFEYRGTLAWIFGSGFPKSLNVSRALADIPACSCAEVSSDLGSVVDAASPPGLGGAGVGAEPGAVSLAGLSAGADGLGLEPSSETDGRKPAVQSGVEGIVGHLDPVVLGPLDMAGVAEGQEVVGCVGSGKVEPEALRDKVVDDQPLACSAVGANTVASNDLGADGLPPDTLVSPLLAAPSGVIGADQPSSVVAGHASSGTVGPRATPLEVVSSEVGSAGLADKHGHGKEHTAKRAGLQCEACGGVISENIPEGLGSALKPAMELICLARKPLSEKSIAANVLKWGTGALNIDGCRIGFAGDSDQANATLNSGRATGKPLSRLAGKHDDRLTFTPSDNSGGRWPANLCHDGSDEAVAGFPADAGGGFGKRGGNGSLSSYGFAEGSMETVGFGDSGSAARFFYCAKASKLDRIGSDHPTVKPVELMRWLVRLVTPPRGLVLDPFAGSGSTGIAAFCEGFDALLIELREEAAADAQRRIDFIQGMGQLRALEMARLDDDKRKTARGDDLPLFGAA